MPLINLLFAFGVVFARSADGSEMLAGAPRLESVRLHVDQASQHWRLISADTGAVVTPAIDSVRSTEPNLEANPPAPVRVASTDPAVLHACERIKPSELFRAHGSFGKFQGYAGHTGPEGLSDLRLHGRVRTQDTPGTPPQQLTWDQVDKVEVRGGSGVRGAVTGGVLFGGFGALVGMAAVAVSSSTDASVGEGAAVGFLYLAPVGIVLGGLSGMAIRRWVPVYKRSVLTPGGTAPSHAAAPVPPQEQGWVYWLSSQLLLSRPDGEFQPPNSERALGLALTVLVEPARWPAALRFEYGFTLHGSSVHGVRVDNPNGIWVDELQTVETGSRLTWGMVGGQWSPPATRRLLYLYAMAGFESVSPMEKLGDGYPVVEADVPGLPPSESGFAWSAGVGTRLRVPGLQRLAVTGEFDYRHLGAATYVTAPGVQGDYPSTHYVVANGPVSTWTARVGLAVARGEYQ